MFVYRFANFFLSVFQLKNLHQQEASAEDTSKLSYYAKLANVKPDKGNKLRRRTEEEGKKKNQKIKAEDDFGDDFGDDDLFGDDGDDAEAEALAAKMAAAAKKKKKEKPKARSMIVLEVKPFDADTDLGDARFEYQEA